MMPSISASIVRGVQTQADGADLGHLSRDQRLVEGRRRRLATVDHRGVRQRRSHRHLLVEGIVGRLEKRVQAREPVSHRLLRVGGLTRGRLAANNAALRPARLLFSCAVDTRSA